MAKQDVEVSVLLIAYNHEKFIRRCLENVVNQKVNFKYEIIIHDDASTDGTKKIIQEFVEKYPDLIIPIYQTENQYSKGSRIIDNFLVPKARGKYLAFCECDDYWCDENKLQLQYDFMESHPECSGCFHNTRIHVDFSDSPDKLENNWKELHFLTEAEVFKMGLIHTSSFFLKREYYPKLPEYGKKVWTQDFVIKTTYYRFGKLAVLPGVISVYNVNNGAGSVTSAIFKPENREKLEARIDVIEKYLIDFKSENQEFSKTIDGILLEINFCKVINKNLYLISLNSDKKKHSELLKEIRNHKFYKTYIKRLPFKQRVKQKIKYNLPFWLWKKLRKNKIDGVLWME